MATPREVEMFSLGYKSLKRFINIFSNGLRIREVFVPVYGNFMYRNRTLDNPEFMKDVDEKSLRGAIRREKISRLTSLVAVPLGIGMAIGRLIF